MDEENNKNFENLEGLSWENFFEQVDKQFEEDDGKWNGSNEIVAFSGVATLPHDKAVCYGVCTVSQVPKLVKCEDCSLVVKMVGFGHHRKFRHRESRLLTRQAVKDPDDSSNSDSNDDCQGFLLSPPHHHLSVASTSESSIFEGHWRATHPLDPSSKVSTPPPKQTTGANKQQPAKANEPPRLYGVEKWNDLRLVLKRTPEKLSSAPQNAEINHQHNSKQNVQQQQNLDDVSTKKLRKPPTSRAIGSKRKRKKKTSRKPKESDDGEEANDEESPQSGGKVYQPPNDLQECDTFTDDHDDDSFVTIPAQLSTPSNDDSFVTIPTQLTPSTAANFWDPREAAGRPDVVKGTFKKTPLSNKLTSHSAPIKKTMLNLSVRQYQTTSCSASSMGGTNLESNKRDANLDKIAGPSILKRSGQLTSPQYHQPNIHRIEDKSGGAQQIYNKYSGINYKPLSSMEKEQPPQSQHLQHQFSKMQQQIQKQRGLTRDFDAISPRNRKPVAEEADPDSLQPSHSPSSDTSSSTSNIYMDAQESLTMTQSNDPTCHSNFVNKMPNAAVQSNEFSRSNQFIREGISNPQKSPAMFRLLRSPNSGNEGKTSLIKNNPNMQWKGTDSNSSGSPLSTPQQRKISNTSYSGRSYITPSGTRFVPVDPRGLVTMQKNSASNSITSSKSNSPIAAIPSTPISPAYINSPSRCEIINTNVDVRTSRENNQNSFVDDYEQQPCISSTPKTNINNVISSTTNRRQQQHFSTNQTILNNNSFFRKRQIVEEISPQALMTSTPNRYQRTPTSAMHNTKRFRPVIPQEGDHQQYAVIDPFSPDTAILQPPRVRTIYPQKQHPSISVSPIPGTSSIVDVQQPTSFQLPYQNQVVNQRIHPSSSQAHFASNTLQQQHPQFRQAFTSTIQQRQQLHYFRQQQPNLIMRSQLNRGINASNYFPKSLSSISGEFALEQQQHYSQRFQYDKQQFINSAAEDPQLNEYVIGSPPSEHFPERMAAGLYDQALTENPSGLNLMRRTDQQQQQLQPYTYTTPITSTPTIRRLPSISTGYNNSNPQHMQINNSHQQQQQQHFVSSNRFTSPIAHNIPAFLQPSVPISLEYNIQHHQQQHYHQRVATEFRPGMESAIDPHVIDPPPILEAEGRLSSMETISIPPPIYNNRQLGVVCSNETSSVTTNLPTLNKSHHSNEEDPGTRSSSASDLDLREIVNIPSSQ